MENSIKEIRQRLQEANQVYRMGSPIMPDREYDNLEHQLMQLDPNNDWFKRGLNDDTPRSRKVQLPFPMMSLDKVKSVEELLAWVDNQPPHADFVITPKFDGMSMGVKHSIKNVSREAFSRGDGTIGQDCTEHFKKIVSINTPKENVEGNFVRGEVLMTWSDFEKFKTLMPEAKNPRNSTTGLMNGDFDPDKEEMYKCLSFLPYQICDVEGKVDKIAQLVSVNGDCEKISTPFIVLTQDDLRNNFTPNSLEMFLLSKFCFFKEQFPCDGLVIDVNQAKYRHGTNANGNPSYTIAYKHPLFSETAETTIFKIERNVNREGIVTPVLHINPVFISGAEISKVNGINMKYVDEWGLYPGVKVKVVRSGEVIPKVISVEGITIPFREDFKSQAGYEGAYQYQLRRRQSCNFPKKPAYLHKCPYCGSQLIEVEDDNVNLKCSNVWCKEKVIQQTVKAFEILGLQEFGEGTFRQLHKVNLITEWVDVFRLRPDLLKGLEGWGEKTIQSFIEEVNKVRSVPFARLAHATGYFGSLGEKTIQLIIDNIMEVLIEQGSKNLSIPLLCQIPGVAEKTAFQFLNGYCMIEKDFHYGYLPIKPLYWKTPARELKGNSLNGMKVCMTGFRDESLKGQIEENGGKVTDNVSKDTTCLLCKDKQSNSGKLKKAQQMGIEILTKTEFIEKYLN